MSDKPLDNPVGAVPKPTDDTKPGTAKGDTLRPSPKGKSPKASSHPTPASGKEPERIAGIVPAVFGSALYRMLYRGLLGSPFASDFDLRFMMGDPAVSENAVKFIASLHKPNRKRGRPRKKDVTEALQMKSEGKSFKEIYAILGKHTETEKLALRAAVRKRRGRDREGDKSVPENVPS